MLILPPFAGPWECGRPWNCQPRCACRASVGTRHGVRFRWTCSSKRSKIPATVWGGRRARTRGKERNRTDLDTRAGALNWARLAAVGLGRDSLEWIIAGT
jgi:hypothetical protein